MQQNNMLKEYLKPFLSERNNYDVKKRRPIIVIYKHTIRSKLYYLQNLNLDRSKQMEMYITIYNKLGKEKLTWLERAYMKLTIPIFGCMDCSDKPLYHAHWIHDDER